MRTIKKKLTASHKGLGKLEMEVEISQAETLQEAVNWSGGERQALEGLNWLAQFRAASGIRSRASNAAETETKEVAFSAFEKIALEAIPAAGRVGPTKADKLSFADEIQRLKAAGEEVSGEKLLELAEEYGIA